MGLSLTKKKRTAADAWIESLDPLNGLSIAQARNVHNAARKHGSPLLQKMFSEIEESDPVLMTCVERRQSALAGLGWRTVANASARDQTLAEEQRAALEEFANGVGNLDDAIEHLGLGFFRGFSVCQPIWDGNGVRHIELLDSWNFLKGDDGGLLWNPECSMDPARCVPITPEARAMVFRRRRAIDWPALNIYIRKYIGERDWGRFLERYGIPPVDVVMAPNTTNAQRDDYLESAEAARDGRPAAWPAGSQISRAEGSRGQDPFSAYLEHQEKLVVLMATGGTLTSLAQADTGSLAGGAQMDVWTQIVARDGVAISAALHRDLFAPFLREAFPRWPVSARLELGREDEPTAEEAADMAVKLRGAGYRVDQSQLEEATGYKLEREEAPQQQPGFGGGLALNKAGGKVEDRMSEAEGRLAAAMQRDLRPVAKAIAEGLKKRNWGALRERLSGVLPECGTESADVLEDAMREDGEEAQKNKKDGETEAVANSGTSEGARKGWKTRRKNGWTSKQYEENKAKVDSLIADLNRKGPNGEGKAWKNNPQDLGEISESLAADIRAANPQMKATAGTMQTIDHKQLQHALDEHGVGNEKHPGSIPITHEDLARIPDVLSDYDEIVPGLGKADGKKQEAVIFKKRVEDGTICCVEIDWFSRGDKRQELKFQTMWKEKPEGQK